MVRSSAPAIYRSPRLLAECLLLLQTLCLFSPVKAEVAGNAPPNPPAAESTDTADIPLVLELTLNGAARGLVRFVERQGALWIDVETLRGLGFRLPEGTPGPVRVDILKDVHVAYKAELQTVDITAPLSLLTLSTTVLDTVPSESTPVARASPGALLNYNLYAAVDEHGASTVNAFSELRLFNDAGLFSNTALLQGGRSEFLPRQSNSMRLDSSWTSSYPDRMLSWRIGEIDSLFVTAVLTVVGFSVHDTIVVFDRIRENLRVSQRLSFEQVVNLSIMQTAARSIITSFTVVLVLVAILVAGGSTLKGFALALLIGIVSGTYSSIFNAAPLLVVWRRLQPVR